MSYIDSPPVQMSHDISGVAGPKFTKFVAVVTFSSTVLMQQSTLRSVNPLSNDRSDIEKKKVTSAKHVRRRHRDAGRTNNNNHMKFMVFVLSFISSHCESLSGSHDECRLRGRQPTWTHESAGKSSYHPHPPSPFLIITQPEKLKLILPSQGGRKAEST